MGLKNRQMLKGLCEQYAGHHWAIIFNGWLELGQEAQGAIELMQNLHAQLQPRDCQLIPFFGRFADKIVVASFVIKKPNAALPDDKLFDLLMSMAKNHGWSHFVWHQAGEQTVIVEPPALFDLPVSMAENRVSLSWPDDDDIVHRCFEMVYRRFLWATRQPDGLSGYHFFKAPRNAGEAMKRAAGGEIFVDGDTPYDD